MKWEKEEMEKGRGVQFRGHRTGERKESWKVRDRIEGEIND